MISSNGANPIFFSKKNKDWTSRALAKNSDNNNNNINSN